MHPTSATSSTSFVFALDSSAHLPWSVMSALRAFRFTARATRYHAMPRHAMPRRLARRRASRQGRIARIEYHMLRSLVSICTLDRTRACVRCAYQRVTLERTSTCFSIPSDGTRCHALLWAGHGLEPWPQSHEKDSQGEKKERNLRRERENKARNVVHPFVFDAGRDSVHVSFSNISTLSWHVSSLQVLVMQVCMTSILSQTSDLIAHRRLIVQIQALLFRQRRHHSLCVL